MEHTTSIIRSCICIEVMSILPVDKAAALCNSMCFLIIGNQTHRSMLPASELRKQTLNRLGRLSEYFSIMSDKLFPLRRSIGREWLLSFRPGCRQQPQQTMTCLCVCVRVCVCVYVFASVCVCVRACATHVGQMRPLPPRQLASSDLALIR